MGLLLTSLFLIGAVQTSGTGTGRPIPAKGADATFDVATWNIEWFGSETNGPSDDGQQLANVRRVIEESEIDLWSVQEVDDADQFDALLNELGPDYDGVLGRASTNMQLGFVFRRGVVDPLQVSDAWLLPFRQAFAGRPPLLMRADIILPDTTARMYVVALHMKCCEDGSAQREEAASALKNRIDAQHASDPVLILGDLNDELTRTIWGEGASPYVRFLEDRQNYRFPSMALEEAGQKTWCGNRSCSAGSTLDHIGFTDELFDAYVEGSTSRYSELLDVLNGYVTNTSDHVPVVASFSSAAGTAAEKMVADNAWLGPIHPNPMIRTAAVPFSLDRPAHVTVDVTDALGRRIRTLVEEWRAAGTYRELTDLSGHPPGLYFIRLRIGQKRRVQNGFSASHAEVGWDVRPVILAR